VAESEAIEGNGGCKPRKLKVAWTLSAAQQLQGLWGTDILADMVEQMRREDDKEILRDLIRPDRLIQGYLFNE
jgi:hypothetical protein